MDCRGVVRGWEDGLQGCDEGIGRMDSRGVVRLMVGMVMERRFPQVGPYAICEFSLLCGLLAPWSRVGAGTVHVSYMQCWWVLGDVIQLRGAHYCSENEVHR